MCMCLENFLSFYLYVCTYIWRRRRRRRKRRENIRERRRRRTGGGADAGGSAQGLSLPNQLGCFETTRTIKHRTLGWSKKKKKEVSEKNVMKTSRKEKENHRPPATGLPTSSSHYRVHSPATAGPAAAAAAAAWGENGAARSGRRPSQTLSSTFSSSPDLCLFRKEGSLKKRANFDTGHHLSNRNRIHHRAPLEFPPFFSQASRMSSSAASNQQQTKERGNADYRFKR